MSWHRVRATSVAVLLIVSGCVASPSSPEGTFGSPSPEASVGPTPTATETPDFGAFLEAGYYWSAVAAHSVGTVAITSSVLLTSDAEATAWTPVDLGEQACPEALAANDSVVVAVGVGSGACHAGGFSTPAAWISEDGRTWSSATLRDADAQGGAFSGVVAGPAGFVAWGNVGSISEAVTDPFVGALYAGVPWMSADGRSWAPVVDQEPFAHSRVTRIVAGGPGYVALGEEVATTAPYRQVVWTSTDGQTWDRTDDGLPFEPRSDTGPPLDLGGADEHLVVWQWVDSGPAHVWESADGLTWQPMDELPMSAFGSVTAIRLLGDRFFAFGSQVVAGAGISPPCTKDQVLARRCYYAAAIWMGNGWGGATTPDWELLPTSAIPESDLVQAMLLTPGGYLAFGSLPDGPAAMWSSSDALTWTRQPISLTEEL